MDGPQGFLPWVKEIIRLKDHLGEEDIRKGLCDGASMAKSQGTALVGDHRSLPFSGPDRGGRPVVYEFREYLGSREDSPPWEECGTGLFSLAAHAPHTTAPWLIRSLKQSAAARGRVFSLHVAESEEEASFIRTGCGPWAALLSGRGVDFSRRALPARSPLWHLDTLGVLDPLTLAVHLVQAGPEDLDLMSSKFRKQYSKGSQPDPERQNNPTPAELRETLERVHRQALSELAACSEQQLAEPIDEPYAVTPTKLGALFFCSHHEMLHAGQIGLLRRLLFGRGLKKFEQPFVGVGGHHK